MFDEIKSISGFIIVAFLIIVVFLVIFFATDSIDSREFMQRVIAAGP